MYLISLLIFGFVSVVLVIGESVTTVYRCCSEGEILLSDFKCGRTTKKWRPTIVTVEEPTPLNNTQVEKLLKEWKIKVARPKCEKNQRSYLAKLQPNHEFVLWENGNLWLKGEYLPPTAFCVDHDSAIVCVKNEDSSTADYLDSPAEQVKRVYVKKCCSGGLYSDEVSGCVLRPQKTPTITEFLQNTTSLNVLNVSNTFLDTGFPYCEEGIIPTGKLSDHDSSLQQDGSLLLPTAKVVLQPTSFCLEYYEGRTDSVPTIFTCPNFLPYPANGSHIAPDQTDIRLTIYPLGLFVSAFFLAATLAAGCLLPTTHHMLHWRCQTCHVACLMVGYFILAITQIAGHKFPVEMCKTFAIIMHIVFLAAFFWLNTMCFNIWWTFRDLRPTSLDKGQEVWRLRMYELYAWGCPLIIATIAAVFDHLPDEGFPSLLKPKFGEKNCWFHGDLEILTYFFGPVGVLLCLNLVLFALTARELTCGLWRSEVVKSSTERATLGRVCIKLVIVMGITWIADVTSWAVGGPQSLWYVTDVLNTLQGVFIFIVVGCQPQIWAAIKRLWCLKEPMTTSVNGNQQSCSQDVPSMGDSISNNTQNTSVKVPAGETIC